MRVSIMGIEDIRGIDVSYSFICDRRLWLSLHGDIIIDGSEYIYEGKNLEEFRKKPGYIQMKIGRNKLDSIEIKDEVTIIHEFKRGRKAILPDIMQVSHYINLYQSTTGREAMGIIHLSSRKTEIVKLNPDILYKLNNSYKKILKLQEEEIAPPPVKNNYCFRGCSLVEFCWGDP